MMKFGINPDGSNFSYEELKRIVEQCLSFFRRATGRDIAPVTRTTETRGTYDNRVISFLPRDQFSNPTVLALAAAGIWFNRSTTGHMDLHELRWLIMHELAHNFGLKHDPNSRYTVMSTRRFRTLSDYTLLWRQDLIGLGSNVALCSADEGLRIMIPAITIINVEGEREQWAARLRVLKPGVWVIDKSYFPDDGIQMIENARLTDNDELHLVDVDHLGLRYQQVRFKITPDLKFLLIT